MKTTRLVKSLRNLLATGPATASLLAVSSASAALVQYHLVWSGTNFANTAVADGVMTIDTALFPNGSGFYGGLLGAGSPVVALTVTVSGATYGNGTFTIPDFNGGFLTDISTPIDFGVEWIGQPGFNDLNFFGVGTAPSGFNVFVLAADGGTGDEMQLVSVTPGAKQNFAKGDAVPGTFAGAVFKSFGMPAINDSVVTAFIGKWSTNIGVFANGALVTKKGDTLPAPSGTATLKTLKDPVIDNANHVAFLATFADGSSGVVSTAPSNTLVVVAQSGQQAAGAPAGAVWKNFQSVALPGGGKGALILGNMEQGPGGITAANDNGLWATDSGGTMHLALQEGTTIIGTNQVKSFKALGPVAGVPGQTRSFNAVGTLAAQVTFTNGATAVVSVSLP